MVPAQDVNSLYEQLRLLRTSRLERSSVKLVSHNYTLLYALSATINEGIDTKSAPCQVQYNNLLDLLKNLRELACMVCNYRGKELIISIGNHMLLSAIWNNCMRKLGNCTRCNLAISECNYTQIARKSM